MEARKLSLQEMEINGGAMTTDEWGCTVSLNLVLLPWTIGAGIVGTPLLGGLVGLVGSLVISGVCSS